MNYFSEPSLIALHPQTSWYPTPKLGLAFSPILYWRQSMNDGIYNFAGYPLSRGAPGSGRYVGTEFFFPADYQISEQLSNFRSPTIIS
jgi:Alginate export